MHAQIPENHWQCEWTKIRPSRDKSRDTFYVYFPEWLCERGSTVFWQTPRSCGNLIAVRIHIPEFTRRNRFKIQCLIPFWALPNTVTLYFGVIYILFLKCRKVFKRTILHDCSTTATGSRKRRKAHKLSNGSLLWQQQVCNTILKCVL